MSPPPPPPPPAPSCPQGGTVWDGDIPESAFKTAAATTVQKCGIIRIMLIHQVVVTYVAIQQNIYI
jgi:hypothetical protein